jgi:YjjG family noncanonical pyrimidine nucleotidase
MAYNLFLFDADDTLFDFKAAEQQAFASSFKHFTDAATLPELFKTYRVESDRVWRLLELGQISKDELKVERFRRSFEKHGIDFDPARASDLYLEALSEGDALIPHAVEICQFLSEFSEIGIVTNGIVSVQKRRLAKSKIASYISFVAVSEECGFAKPDRRFFEYSIKLAKKFVPESTLVIGDRLETDIAGAHAFGVDACFFNPNKTSNPTDIRAKYEIAHLSELQKIARPLTL